MTRTQNTSTFSQPTTPDAPAAAELYRAAIDRAADMVHDRASRALAKQHGLRLVNVAWEDAARAKGSTVGPNISDVTIQVQDRDEQTGDYRLTCMPVLRHPNFADRSADVFMEDILLRVGNEHGEPLRRISLRDYLGNLRRYLSEPGSWAGDRASLLAERDTHVLVSAQACCLPVPKGGQAEFNPVVFNYQSSAGAPAVLAILATREGTSATILDNTRDGFKAGGTWGQRLFFNKSGERCSLTATRLRDFDAAGGDTSDEAPSVEAAWEDGLNRVLLIQVPLVHPELPTTWPGEMEPVCFCEAESDMEDAVIGHGEMEGPFTEIADLPIERDARFPVRVTVQFYKATESGVISPEDIAAIAAQIERVYADARYVGSLVVDGDTGRPTEAAA